MPGMQFPYPRKSSIPNSPYISSRSTSYRTRRRLRNLAPYVVGLIAFVWLLIYLFSGPSNPDAYRRPPAGIPEVVIVTTLEPHLSPRYRDNIIENRRDYAARHGYTTFFPNTTDYDLMPNSPSSWSTIPALRHAMTKWPQTPWLWYLTSEALIMNSRKDIYTSIVEPRKLESLMITDQPVVPPDSVIKTFSHLRGERVDFVLTQDKEGLAGGSMLIRTGEWAKYFLDAWFDPMYRSYNFQKAENHALEHIVQWHGTILAKLALVPQRVMNSYTREVGGGDSSGLYQEGDFVANFHGCANNGNRNCEEEMAHVSRVLVTSLEEYCKSRPVIEITNVCDCTRTIMSSRRAGNTIRGPRSALTDFLAANNISAQQIRDDYQRRRTQPEAGDAGEGSSAQTPVQDEDEALAAAAQAEEDEKKSKKRKRTEKEAIDKIKKAKATKKGKKAKKDDPDDESEYEDDFYKKARPAPGQFEHCEICSKRFTVTPYSKEGPDGGLLCTPCGKELAKDIKKEQKATSSKPVGKKRRKLESDRLDGVARCGAKSLVQLCIEKVAAHHDSIEELGDLPQPLVERLSQLFSKKRVMKSKTLPLFLRPDLESVVVHDAAYLEEDDYRQMFAVVPKMQKLVLSNACQLKDDAIDYMLERCRNLKHLSLYSANLVSEGMWHRLFREVGTKLQVLKLKWLDAAFEDAVMEDVVKYCPNLERLKLKLCRRLGQDAVDCVAKLPELKHLSLQISREVSNDTLVNLIELRGSGLQTLSLEKFLDVDDAVLQTIHDNCNRLTKLRLSENDTITDAGFAALFTDWRNPPLTFADFNSTRDVDNNNPTGPEEAPIGLASNGFRALMAHSGAALRHLDVASCRFIELSAFIDVFNGAETYPSLEYINISFCNKVDTSVVAGIFKSCPALKKLVAFGCFDVRDVVVPRSIALIGVPTAQDAIEQFGVGIGVEEAIGRMVEVGA
ncbi:glycosyltransferase family 34 protein [Baudoinia panamericana UAMH 10762]|uniref:Glycosyltransferase family 34 protein n=1 Tax=Baudoinia panamericana (strain UAMH 10762) TaxID=717646 RepID=M2MJI4_BAUPA|nr:glycosyltransferase family 34 protein [Baudoinia panamericana UAMH 10762]EMC96851.1 glycosyltransferase family 34 protein [Baudoinia panamericana UAMH 10762]